MPKEPYSSMARWYDRIFEPMNSGLRRLGIKLHRPHAGMKVLDVGCGTGIHLDYYRQAGCELYGIDPSQAMLDVARERLGDGAQLHHGSAAQMPYTDGQFDLAVCMLALHEMHPEVRLQVARETNRVVKPDGRILWIDFHTGPLKGLQGWATGAFIYVSEVLAGREHFRNSRIYLKEGGLRHLIAELGLEAEKEVIVGGGNMALYVVRPDGKN